MADEISITARLRAYKSLLNIDRSLSNQTFDMSGSTFYANLQTIGTTYEAVTVGADLGTAGWSMFINHDTTNYVEIGLDVGAAFYGLIKLMPGELALFRLTTSTFYARANTGACKLEVVIVAD